MYPIRNIFFLLSASFFLNLLCACRAKRSAYLIEGIELPSSVGNNKATVSRVSLIDNFISEISNTDDIRWTNAFTGEKSAQAFRYDWLSKWATNEELQGLLKNKNGNIKVYAFLCLKERKHVDLKPIVLQSLSDTSCFIETYACIGTAKRINSYFFEATTGWFTEKEIHRYRGMISSLNAKCKGWPGY